jgi:hypothetical protein
MISEQLSQRRLLFLAEVIALNRSYRRTIFKEINEYNENFPIKHDL